MKRKCIRGAVSKEGNGGVFFWWKNRTSQFFSNCFLLFFTIFMNEWVKSENSMTEHVNRFFFSFKAMWKLREPLFFQLNDFPILIFLVYVYLTVCYNKNENPNTWRSHLILPNSFKYILRLFSLFLFSDIHCTTNLQFFHMTDA